MNSSDHPASAIVSVDPAPLNGRLPVDHDPLVRRRDKFGNRLANQGAYDPPIAGELGLDESQVRHLLDRLEGQKPLHAEWLRYFYHEKLHPAHARFKRVLEEEQAALAKRQRRYQEHNEGREAEARRIEETKAEALSLVTSQRQNAESELEDAHSRAARDFARIGQTYDPDAPAEGNLLEARKSTLQEEADHNEDPYYEKEGRWHLLPWPVTTFFSLVVGLLLGVSLGVVGGFFEPDNFQRKLAIVGVSAIVGIGVALFSRYAVLVAFKLCGEQSLLHQRAGKRALVYLLATLVLAAIFVTDMFVERQGILKLAQINNSVDSLGGAGGFDITPDWLYYLVAAVVMLGYLVYSAYEGFIKGRREVILNRLRRSKADRDVELHRELVDRPEVQSALESLARVRECSSRAARLKEEATLLAEPFDRRIEEARAAKQNVPLDMEPHQLHRIQDCYDNLLGAQRMFDQRVEHLLKQLEPLEGMPEDPFAPSLPERPKTGLVSRGLSWLRTRLGGGAPSQPEGPYVS